jgi:hypothetical protein
VSKGRRSPAPSPNPPHHSSRNSVLDAELAQALAEPDGGQRSAEQQAADSFRLSGLLDVA